MMLRKWVDTGRCFCYACGVAGTGWKKGAPPRNDRPLLSPAPAGGRSAMIASRVGTSLVIPKIHLVSTLPSGTAVCPVYSALCVPDSLRSEASGRMAASALGPLSRQLPRSVLKTDHHGSLSVCADESGPRETNDEPFDRHDVTGTLTALRRWGIGGAWRHTVRILIETSRDSQQEKSRTVVTDGKSKAHTGDEGKA